MKILCLTPHNPFIKTPETGFAELLHKHGHEVLLIFTTEDFTLIKDERVIAFDPDVIFSMMEYSLPIAIQYTMIMNKPLYAHIECIPPWRTGIDPPEDYGLDLGHGYGLVTDTLNGDSMVNTYKFLLKLFDKADYRTISQESWRYTFEKFTGEKLDAGVKYYTYDLKELKKYKGDYDVKYQIYTIARFVPIKRVQHIIMALGLIEKSIRPTYALIGYGQLSDYLKHLAQLYDVDVVFYGDGKDGVKEKVIQESLFGVQIFSGMPIMEGAFYNKPTVTYGIPQTKEVFGNSVVYAVNNNINSLKENIEYLLLNQDKIKPLGEKANDMILNNKTNIWDNDKYVYEVEKNLMKAIENYKLKYKGVN